MPSMSPIGLEEAMLRLKSASAKIGQAAKLIQRAYTDIEAALYDKEEDSPVAGFAALILNYEQTLVAADSVLEDVYVEVAAVKSGCTMYRRCLKAGFPYGVTTFTLDNGGAAGNGRITVSGRTSIDATTGIMEELFVAGDILVITAGAAINAADLHNLKEVVSASTNVVEFNEPFNAGSLAAHTDLEIYCLTKVY